MTTIAESKALALAKQFDIEGSPTELIGTLKATSFKGSATNEQFTALMIVAGQYGLNPFTREIYAFPDRNNGIVPVVGSVIEPISNWHDSAIPTTKAAD